MGRKILDKTFFNEWYDNYKKACLVLDSNQKEIQLNKLYVEVETNLEPVGCSAIEDKLQIVFLHFLNIRMSQKQ